MNYLNPYSAKTNTPLEVYLAETLGLFEKVEIPVVSINGQTYSAKQWKPKKHGLRGLMLGGQDSLSFSYLPFFTSDIAAAKVIEEEMIDRGWSLCITKMKSSSSVVKFYRPNTITRDMVIATASGPESMAICLAAEEALKKWGNKP